MKGVVIKREGDGIGPSDSLCLSYGSKLVRSQSVGYNSLNSWINVEAQMVPPISKYKINRVLGQAHYTKNNSYALKKCLKLEDDDST
jgi:hypothetical protein